MKKEHDFSKGRRGEVVHKTGKTYVTLHLDDAIVEEFKVQSEKTGKACQTLINEALDAHLGLAEKPPSDVLECP